MAYKPTIRCPNCQTGEARLHCTSPACPPFYCCDVCNHWTRYRKEKGLKGWKPDQSVRMYPATSL